MSELQNTNQDLQKQVAHLQSELDFEKRRMEQENLAFKISEQESKNQLSERNLEARSLNSTNSALLEEIKDVLYFVSIDFINARRDN